MSSGSNFCPFSTVHETTFSLYVTPYGDFSNLNDFLSRMPQLDPNLFTFTVYSNYNNHICYKVGLNSYFSSTFIEAFDSLSYIERVYVLGNLYTYFKDQGNSSVGFSAIPGSPVWRYTELRRDVNYDLQFDMADIVSLKRYSRDEREGESQRRGQRQRRRSHDSRSFESEEHVHLKSEKSKKTSRYFGSFFV